MKECDAKSKELRSQLEESIYENIHHIGKTTPIHKGVIKDKAINTLIQEIDAQKQEEEYAKKKLPEHWEWIDLEARNTFHEGIRAGTLKCIAGFNYYGCRNKKINEGLVSDRCPRCNQVETWEHVILC